MLHQVSTRAATDISNVFETTECYTNAEQHLVLAEPVRRLNAKIANNPDLFGGFSMYGWRYVQTDSLEMDFLSENASLSKSRKYAEAKREVRYLGHT